MSDTPFHITDDNFDAILKDNKLVLVDFWASWCGPCRALAPTIEELAKEYSSEVLIGKLDVDSNPKKAECFQVFSIPTLILFKNGIEIERMVGLCAKKSVEALIQKNL
jgi:thioredoxin 1